jgi:hypothetical protein
MQRAAFPRTGTFTPSSMPKYGLQEVQGSRIVVPHTDRLRPRREFLEERFELFKRAA